MRGFPRPWPSMEHYTKLCTAVMTTACVAPGCPKKRRSISHIGQGRIGRPVGTLDRTPSRRRGDPLSDAFRCAGIVEFPCDGLGDHHLTMEDWEHIDVPGENQVIDRGRIGDDHYQSPSLW